MNREELIAALELPTDPVLHSQRLVWFMVSVMTIEGFRFILSRSHHRPKGLPAWRASFCRYGGKANRWFCGHPGEAVVKAAMIARYNREHPEDRYVQRLNTPKGHYEE